MKKVSKPKSKSSKKDLKSEKSIKSTTSKKSGKKSELSEEKKSDQSKSPEKENEENPNHEILEVNNFDPNNLNIINTTTPRTPINYNINTINSNPLNQIIQKCEGCFENFAVGYCKECEKSFCPKCDNQLHNIPSYKNHERIALNEMSHLKKMCYHHNSPLKFYCESCDEPICNECQIMGPHNTKLHKITNILEAFKDKYKRMNDIVQNNILKRYEDLTNNLSIIDSKIEELDILSTQIEKDIISSFNQMIEGLNNEKGKRIAILNYESANIQKELVKLDEIFKFVNESKETKDNDAISDFLLRYKQMNEDIEFLISKPTDLNIDNTISNLPSELSNQSTRINNYDKIKKLLKIKDDIIWELLNKLCHGTKIERNDVENSTKINVKISGLNNSGQYTITTNNQNINNKNLCQTIYNQVMKNNLNLYQIFSEFSTGDGNDFIEPNNISLALKKIGIECNENDIIDLLNSINIQNENQISIKDLTKGIISNTSS